MAETKTIAVKVKEPKFPTNVPTFTIGNKCDGCVDVDSRNKPIIKARDPQGITITCNETGGLADPFMKELADKGKLPREMAALQNVVHASAPTVMKNPIVKTWLKEKQKMPPPLD